MVTLFSRVLLGTEWVEAWEEVTRVVPKRPVQSLSGNFSSGTEVSSLATRRDLFAGGVLYHGEREKSLPSRFCSISHFHFLRWSPNLELENKMEYYTEIWSMAIDNAAKVDKSGKISNQLVLCKGCIHSSRQWCSCGKLEQRRSGDLVVEKEAHTGAQQENIVVIQTITFLRPNKPFNSRSQNSSHIDFINHLHSFFPLHTAW